MNLYTPAGGLCETHVTWEDIEEDMQRELDTVATFGPNKTAKNIGEGKGFLSRIVLIDPDWQHKDKELPKKFVVKILSQLTMQQFTRDAQKERNVHYDFMTPEFMAALENQQKILHNTEVIVYEHILKLPEGKVPHMKIYYMTKFSENNSVKGYIIMEYVEDIQMIHIYQNVKPEAIEEILRAKAVLEAMSLKFDQMEKDVFTEKPFSERFAQIFTKEVIETMITSFRQFGDGKLTEKTEQMEAILPDITNFAWADQLPDELGMQRVLCHGDLWPMNILWKPKGDDVTSAAIIDYQLKESYRRFMPVGGFMIVPSIGPLFEILCKNTDEEQKNKSLEIVMEKTECLLEDMLHYNQRNKELRKKEQVL